MARSYNKSLAAGGRRGFAAECSLQVFWAGYPGAMRSDNLCVLEIQFLQCLGEGNGRR